MKRRALLASVAGSSALFGAGCISSQRSSCGSVEVVTAFAEVNYECDFGTVQDGDLVLQLEDCQTDLTLEFLEDGEVVQRTDIEPDGESWSGSFGPGYSGTRDMRAENSPHRLKVPGAGDKKIQVRGPDGDVLATGTLEMDHYRGDLSVEARDLDFQPETFPVGEPVTISFTVRMVGSGGGGPYTARVLADDTVVGTRSGSAEGSECEYGREGTAYEVTDTFEDPGDYELTVDVIAEDATEPRFSRPIGTVTVERGE